jgi:hypothetical protein
MKLQGRDLSSQLPALAGDDVKLLQCELQQLGYAISTDESSSSSFGPGTHQAVVDFQTTHGLEANGIVDARTALLINRAVDGLHPQPEPSVFLVKGSITDQNGHPLPGLIVRGFERGMRSEGLLRETRTDAAGQYQITCNANQLHHAVDGVPDLMIRVFSADGRVLGASPTPFDAPPIAVIDLEVSIPPQGRLSEWEETLGEITPFLEGVALVDLTDDDLSFLYGETRIDLQRLEFVRQSARFSQKTQIPPEAFYGWARENLPLDLDQLLILADSVLRTALNKAIDDNIIAVALQSSLDEIMRRIDILRSVPASPSISELVSTLHLTIPSQLSSFLVQNGINTLADIRKAGGLSQLANLPVPAADPLVRTLDAHAELIALSPEIVLNAKLIDRGYYSVRSVADSHRRAFVQAAGDSLGVFRAAQMQVRAQARTNSLDNLRAAAIVSNGNQPQLSKPIAPAVCQCEDCQAGVSPLAYLVDLLDYTTKRIVDGAQNPLDFPSLIGMLHQPLGDLIASCDAVNTPIRQVRICVEVLRSVLGQTPVDDSMYRQAAYLALLDRVGISYEELRLAHSASPDKRHALAARVGIDLNDNRPDNLDTLLFDLSKAAQPAESDLDNLFGLTDTHVVMLGPRKADPWLLTWQRAHLRTLWRDSQSAGGPVIDPDLIDARDFKNPVNNDPTYALQQTRAALLASKETDWRAQVGNQSAKIDALIQGVLADPADLLKIAADRDTGKDITTQLVPLNLDRAAFDRLMDLRAFILSGGSVLDNEWDEFYGILLEVWKRQQFAGWIQEEKKQNIFVSPDFFRIPVTSQNTSPDPSFVFQAWRGSLAARRSWQDFLQARIDQDQALQVGLQAAVDATEEATLSKLRDALLMATDVADQGPEAKAHWFTAQYFLDAKMGACHKTTRVAQAIETVQGFVSAVRNGQLLGQSSFQIDPQYQPTFDEEWRWMGSYSTWRAAMLVFLYPENILTPNLRQASRQTPSFASLIDQIRANPALTPKDACEMAAQYSDYFRDVCNLTVEASCLASTPPGPSDCLHKAGAIFERTLLYVFARSPRGQVYFSTLDPNDATGLGQAFWEAVPGLDAAIQLLGAVPYQVAPGQRFICILAIVFRDGNRVLACTKYDLKQQSWDPQPLYLDVPSGAGAFTAVVKQSASDAQPPHIAVRLENGAVMNRRMNGDLSDWEMNPWLTLVDSSDRAIAGISNMVADDQTLNNTGKVDPNNGFVLFGKIGEDTVYKYFKPYTVPLFKLSGKDELYTTKVPLRDELVQQQSYKPTVVGYVGPTDGFRPDRTYPLYHVAGAAGHQYTTDSKEYDLLLKEQGARDYGVEAYVWISPEQGTVGFKPHKFFDTCYIIADAWTTLDPDPQHSGLLPPAALIGVFSWGLDSGIYAFYEQAGATGYVQISGHSPQYALAVLVGPDRIVTHCGKGPDSKTQYVAQQPPRVATAPYQVVVTKDSGLTFTLGQPLAPLVGPDGPFDITQQLSEADLQARIAEIKAAFDDTGWHWPSSNLVYLQEAYYFVPVALASALHQAGEYTAALDWYRTVYDYSAVAPGKRNIYYGFEIERQKPFVFQRLPNWLQDPLNPHAIAETRYGCYLRFTVISLIRCFLDYGDSEFTRDTAESVELARLLYLTALDLLDVNQLKQAVNKCPTMIATIDLGVPDQYIAMSNDINQDAELINDMVLFQDTTAKVQAVMRGNAPWGDRLEQARQMVAAAKASAPAASTTGELLGQRTNQLVQTDRYLVADPDIAQDVDRAADISGKFFAQVVSSVSGYSLLQLETQAIDLPWLAWAETAIPARSAAAAAIGNRALDNRVNTGMAALVSQSGNMGAQVAQNTQRFTPSLSQQFCVPLNPVLLALQSHAEVCLFNLRHCRNIAGLERQLDPYAAPINIRSDLPAIGTSGTLVLPGTASILPTPYRYSTLIERAKQLVGQAQQLETAYLSALEKRDTEAYNLLKARQDLSLARASVRLHDMQVIVANDGVTLANLQQQQQADQVDHYTALAVGGMSGLEIAALTFQGMGVTHLHAGASMRLANAIITSELPTGLGELGGAVSEVGNALIATSSLLQTMASYERRQQEWQFQKTIALDAARIGAQQTRAAEDQLRVAGQERQIAQLQSDHSEAVANFLSNKFTNAELYDWMSGVLGGIYRYFLQRATSMAQAAGNQLAFERQTPTPPFIQSDYWNPPIVSSSNGGSTSAPDRQGLTGSARLLADITQLDQYAFETNKRKLQLSKIISLAQLAPAEFQLFRETGVMRFSTPMLMFDREFPGHYLRLIRRVKTSVIALIPPTFGIRATLSTSGISRAVIGPDFQTVTIRRDAQFVALSSPQDATGVFDLDIQSDMLLPFEGLGVDTDWELRMPKAANLFDYTSIADVLVAIDYTAMDSADYRTQLLQSAELSAPFSADRPFSFRFDLADQWYDLHNPDQTEKPMVVTFTTDTADFPPNIEDMGIQQVVLYFSRSEGSTFKITAGLRFTHKNGQTVGGSETTFDGVISTRRGNAPGWVPMLGQPPFGVWELDLSGDQDVRGHFQNDEIADILFVVTYSGRRPAWPA